MNIPNTMFDFKAFYDRMAKELPHDAVIAEVGVADGASALYLAEKLHEIGKTFKLYMIDNLDYGKQDQLRTIINNVMHSGLSEFIEILPYDSLHASCRFPDVHFDFVFIDASHKYEFTKADIRLWYRKVKENRILAGHDYNSDEGKEVLQAVNEVIPAYADYTNEKNPIKVLQTEETEKGYGVWWVRKYWQIKIS